MATRVALQVGKTYYVIEAPCLPPVGMRMTVDKAFTGDGIATQVEVTAHEWQIVNTGQTDANEPEFDVKIKTRIVRE